MMRTFRVTWEIDIEAESEIEAARKALAIQRRADSTANMFKVEDDHGLVSEFDLDELNDPSVVR